MRKSFAFVVTIGVFSPLLAVGACTTNGGTIAKGGACTQSIDCQEKLVCIYPVGSETTGTCTDDLTNIVSVPDAASSDAPVVDAPVVDSPVTDQIAPQDNNVPDTSTQDTGTTDSAGD